MRFVLTVVAPVWLTLFAVALRQWLEDHMWLRARKREREPGLNSLADAEVFVADLRAEEKETPVLLLAESRARRVPGSGPDSGLTRQRSTTTPGVGLAGAPAPLEHNETDLRVPRARTTPLVASLRSAPVVPVRSEPVFASAGTPIYDQLCADLKARRRALRQPTAEMRRVFDALVERWLCTHCEFEACNGCPGCSCGCRLKVAA